MTGEVPALCISLILIWSCAVHYLHHTQALLAGSELWSAAGSGQSLLLHPWGSGSGSVTALTPRHCLLPMQIPGMSCQEDTDPPPQLTTLVLLGWVHLEMFHPFPFPGMEMV